MSSHFQYININIDLAMQLGCFYKAAILHQIEVSILKKNSSSNKFGEEDYCFHDGEFYMYDTYEAWSERMPIGTSTIRRFMKELISDGWIKTAFLHPKKHDRTLFYTLDLKKFYKAIAKRFFQEFPETPENTHVLNLSTSPAQIEHMTCSNRALLHTNNSSMDSSKNTNTRAHARVSSPHGDLCLNCSEPMNPIIEEPKKETAPKEQKPTARRSKPLTPRLTTWEESDPLKTVFLNFNKLEIAKSQFDTNNYRTYLTNITVKYGLTTQELEDISYKWQDHHNFLGTKIKDLKKSFYTWIKNYLEWGKNGGSGSGKQWKQQQSLQQKLREERSYDDDKTGDPW